MGVVLPDWADEVLDLIGIAWPNVDEDDFREMATAMREFATALETGGAEAQQAVNAFLESSSSPAIDAFGTHWNKINGRHLANLAQATQLAATAAEIAAYLITAAKIAALVQLAILAAQLIAAAAAAPFTLGLSSLGGAAAVQATRMVVKQLLKEALRAIVEQVAAMALGPAFEALGSMAGDLAIQGAATALGAQDGVDLRQTGQAGKDGLRAGLDGGDTVMELNSAGGGPSAGSKRPMQYDLDGLDELGPKIAKLGANVTSDSDSKLGRAKRRQSRTRGKDELANAANEGLDKALDGIETGAKKLGKHMEKVVPGGLKKMSRNHRDNDKDAALSLDALGKRTDNGTPMYLMGDDGSIRRLRPDGSTSDLTPDDKARIGLSPENIGRPRPGEKGARLSEGTPGNRPGVQSTEVPFGSTDLSRATQLARHSQESYGNNKEGKDFRSNNYAASRITGAGDSSDFIFVTRSNGYRHSERMVMPFIREDQADRVTAMYSEREPCTTGAQCSAWIKEKFPHADITHSVEYGASGESRQRSKEVMQDYLSTLRANRER
ncbi:hypothetical protein MTQ01_13655 [Streptomyces sp. XM4193]|uniref:nucleic acid/nucleotide deaminase domain-containing protein n=1 Tax=Streptomyces sp. XM4193 TaxID=2929782 RepID=UPI001FF9BDAC|nr:nucleic acid/nucleotide deaminase domain-containing protein [Streptomyces sp. XM4193]MCK1797043.1 hypothetical protein [Streptomyces sp. XM4193]